MPQTTCWPALLLAALVPLSGCTQLDGGGLGSAAERFLTGGGTLVLEIDHVRGSPPTTETINQLKAELGRITGKPVQTQITPELPAQGQNYSYSLTELRRMHEQYQTQRDQQGAVVMHALFVDGRIGGSGESQVAGVAFDADAFAVAVGAIDSITSPDGQQVLCVDGPHRSEVMRAVAIHEAGHILGLVNLGLPMVTPHEMTTDPVRETEQNEGEGHSNNEDSVMYWAVETFRGLEQFVIDAATCQFDVPFRFDTNDIQDARAIQGG